MAAQKRFIAAHAILTHAAFARLKLKQPVKEPKLRPMRQPTQRMLEFLRAHLPIGSVILKPGSGFHLNNPASSFGFNTALV